MSFFGRCRFAVFYGNFMQEFSGEVWVERKHFKREKTLETYDRVVYHKRTARFLYPVRDRALMISTAVRRKNSRIIECFPSYNMMLVFCFVRL